MKIGHLIGLCNIIALLSGIGLKPIFVLEGEMPAMKAETAQERLRRPLQRQFKMDEEMENQLKTALELFGLPWVQAPEEAEAQGAYMTRHGCFGLLTTDFDSLLFGAKLMISSLTKQKAEIISLQKVLQSLGLNQKKLILLALMVGTDYNPGGIRGIGPRRATEMLLSMSTDALLLKIKRSLDPGLVEQIIHYYLDPPVARRWRSSRRNVSPRARGFLLDEMKLSPRIVERTIEALSRGIQNQGQKRIDHF